MLKVLKHSAGRILSRPFSICMSLPFIATGIMILFADGYLPTSLQATSASHYATAFAVLAILGGLMVAIGHLLPQQYIAARTLEITGHSVCATIMLAYSLALLVTVSSGGLMAFLVVHTVGIAHTLTAIQISRQRRWLQDEGEK